MKDDRAVADLRACADVQDDLLQGFAESLERSLMLPGEATTESSGAGQD